MNRSRTIATAAMLLAAAGCTGTSNIDVPDSAAEPETVEALPADNDDEGTDRDAPPVDIDHTIDLAADGPVTMTADTHEPGTWQVINTGGLLEVSYMVTSGTVQLYTPPITSMEPWNERELSETGGSGSDLEQAVVTVTPDSTFEFEFVPLD